jgi:hypothetical protein
MCSIFCSHLAFFVYGEIDFNKLMLSGCVDKSASRVGCKTNNVSNNFLATLNLGPDALGFSTSFSIILTKNSLIYFTNTYYPIINNGLIFFDFGVDYGYSASIERSQSLVET